MGFKSHANVNASYRGSKVDVQHRQNRLSSHHSHVAVQNYVYSKAGNIELIPTILFVPQLTMT